MNIKEIISLESKGISTDVVHFLFYYPHNRIYVSDNHRIALWCWIKSLSNGEYEKYNLVRLDYHFDFRSVGQKQVNEFFKNYEKIHDLKKYLDLKRTDDQGNLIECDNLVFF